MSILFASYCRTFVAQLPIFITLSIVKASLVNIPGRMFVLYLVDELAWIVWYDYFAFHTNEQAAVVDNCYLAHFVPDYTGIPIWMLCWFHSVRSTCERTFVMKLIWRSWVCSELSSQFQVCPLQLAALTHVSTFGWIRQLSYPLRHCQSWNSKRLSCSLDLKS